MSASEQPSLNTASRLRDAGPVARNTWSPGIRRYLERRLLKPATIAATPATDLGLVVTIPCFDEPDPLSAVRALSRCAPPASGSVEVLTFFNASEAAPESAKARNVSGMAAINEWRANPANVPDWMRVHTWLDNAVPARDAGVGLARKLLMDEALQRLLQVERPDAAIAGFDADCGCAPNYLHVLASTFANHADLTACSVFFEHPLEGDATHIELYELFLRYYRLGLTWAGSPHAFHTVGSSMAVRASAYAEHGGMNRRQAGEDFYFLQKFMDTGAFADIVDTTVYPSARISTRVPFGTGAAIADAHNTGKHRAFPPLAAFDALNTLFTCAPGLYTARERWRADVPTMLREWLEQQDFDAALAEIAANVSSEKAFARRLNRWMNGFRCMKFLRHAIAAHGPESDPVQAADALLRRLGPGRIGPGRFDVGRLGDESSGTADSSVRDVLLTMRQIERQPGMPTYSAQSTVTSSV